MRNHIRRRDFITMVGGAAAVPAMLWPRAARAQQPGVPAVGFLSSGSPVPDVDRVRAFRRGLSETGLVEGRNFTIEYRWAEGHNDRLPALMADLVLRRMAVIAAAGGETVTLAAKAATATIPIVSGGDDTESWHLAGLYIGRILRGEKP